MVDHVKNIKNPIIRECIKFLNIDDRLYISTIADVPSFSGLGSSSSFTVGLLNALHAIDNYMPTKRELALQAIHVEQDLINESVGSQDQTAAAFGGLNKVTFNDTNNIDEQPNMPMKYGLRGIPTMLIFKGGELKATKVGATTKSNIVSWIKENI